MKYIQWILVTLIGISTSADAADVTLSTNNINSFMANNFEEDDFFVTSLSLAKDASSDSLLSAKIQSFFKNINDYAHEEQRYFPLPQSKKVQECAQHIESLERIQNLSEFIKKVTHAWASLAELVDPQFTQDEDLKKRVNRVHTLLTHGLFLRTLLRLNGELNNHAITCLRQIEEDLNFWEYQLHHPTYHFFHKSPRNWFSNDPQELAVKKNLYLLRHYQSYFFKTIGRLTRHLDTFSEVMPLRTQREWLRTSAGLMHEYFKDAQTFSQKELSEHDLFLLIIKDLEEFSKFDRQIKKELYSARVPSHFVRHWMEYTAGGLATLFAVGYAYANRAKMASLIDRAQASTVKTYNDTIRGPFLKIKEAIFGKTGKESTDAQVSELSTLFKDKVAQFARNGGLPVQRRQLVIQYGNIITEYRNFFRSCLKPTMVLAEGSSGFIINNLTDEQIAQAAERLDVNLLNTILGAVGYQWEHSTLELKATMGSWLKPSPGLQLGGKKGELIDKIAPLAILYTQCRLLTVEDKARMAGEAAEIAAQIGAIFTKQGEMVLTQNRVTISTLALIPAAMMAYLGFKVARKVGSAVISSDYDYGCLRRAFFGAARVLNLYDGAEYNHGQIKDEDLGNLLYSLQTLKYESQFLNEKDRWEFSEDIKQLASPSMNVRQKLRLLNIMINRYAFLHRTALNGLPTMPA